jgi:hypothetical protein
MSIVNLYVAFAERLELYSPLQDISAKHVCYEVRTCIVGIPSCTIFKPQSTIYGSKLDDVHLHSMLKPA